MKHTTCLTIESDDSYFKLSALYYKKENKYYMPDLAFNNIHYCDNTNYFIDTLIPFLKKQYGKMKYIEDKKELKQLTKGRKKELLGIIKEGMKLGFFKELI